MSKPVIYRRRVFYVPGFDPSRLPVVKYRFARGLRCFEQTWSVKTSISQTAFKNAWNVVAAGPNWRTETLFTVVNWNHVAEDISDRPIWVRIPQAIWAFADFAVHALPGYLRENWRYAAFFLYPFVTSFAIATLAFLTGVFAAGATGSLLAGTLVAIIALALLSRWPGRRFYLRVLVDDWIFSEGYVRKGNPTLNARLDRAAHELVAAVRQNDTDEIVVIGHSLGAPVAIDLLDRALRIEPALGQNGPRLALITVGSSILKIGLHRSAARFRQAVERVSSARAIFWAEYQAIADAANFCKRDPVTAMQLPARGVPLVRMVRLEELLDPDNSFHRYPLWIHAQFVCGNTLRNAYDYYMLVCGPLSVERQAHGDGAVSAIGADGALPSGQQPREM